MREIVRMTAQKQPLEVGLPLYPFSHTTLFRKDESPRTTPEDGAAPLPNAPYEEQGISPPTSSQHSGPTHRRSVSGASWPMHDISVSPAGV